MGVLKALRNESAAQFVMSAEELRTFTAITVTKLSQKYRDLGNIHAYNLSQRILDDLIRANSLYLSKDRPEHYQERQDLFSNISLIHRKRQRR